MTLQNVSAGNCFEPPLSHVTTRNGQTFAKQVTSTVTEIRTKFELFPTAVATVSHEFCPLHGMLKKRNVSYNALVTPPSKTLGDQLGERLC